MSFEKFIYYGSSTRDTLTIRTNDLLFIPKTILKKMNNISARYALIFIDEKLHKIGIQFCSNIPEENYRKLNFEKSGVSINIAPILRYFNIKRVSKKILINFDIEDNLLIFKLPKR